ncbi:hypothetical protein U1Q18_016428 [Sarracenia purpurea var. burkii]
MYLILENPSGELWKKKEKKGVQKIPIEERIETFIEMEMTGYDDGVDEMRHGWCSMSLAAVPDGIRVPTLPFLHPPSRSPPGAAFQTDNGEYG